MVINSSGALKIARGRGRPRQSDVLLSRQSMLLLAFDAFAKQGFDGVTMRDLAATCNLSNTALHNYFGTKEALWREAANTVCAPILTQLLAQIVTTNALPETLRALFVESLRLVTSQRLVLTFMFREGELDNARGEYLRTHFTQPFFARLNPLLAEGRANGVLADVPAAGVNALTSGLMRFMLMPGVLNDVLAPHLATENSTDAFIDAMVETLLHGILRRPAVP